jgi:hypothetical protein
LWAGPAGASENDLTSLSPKVLSALSGDLRRPLDLYAPKAAELSLNAFLAPGVVLFSSSSDRIAEELVEQLQETREALEGQAFLQDRSLEEKPVVVFHVDDQHRYGQIIDSIVEDHRYLEEWATAARHLPGFALYRPEICVILDQPRKSTATQRNNLLVHLTTKVLLHQLFGVQPLWIREACALHIEAQTSQRLHAFCGHQGFVARGQPSAWKKDMCKAWRGHGEAALDQILEMTQQHFEHKTSLRALRLFRYLAYEEPDALHQLLIQLAADRKKNSRQDRNYSPSGGRQRQLLEESLGEGWEASVLPGLEKGDSKVGRTSRSASSRVSVRR